MRSRVTLAAVLLIVGPVAACTKKAEAPAAPAHDGVFAKFGQKGRYVGVGLYVPGAAWTRLEPPQPTPAAAAPNPRQAGLQDDEVVIVVADTATGELRQCGNLSGHCVTLRPWAKPAETSGPAPLHAPTPEPAPQPTAKIPTA